MNPRHPNARKVRLPKLPKNVGTLSSQRSKASLPRDELYPALSKNIIKVNGSLYKYTQGSTVAHQEFSPRTVHTEPIVLPSIRRKVQEYLEGDLKDKNKLASRYKSDSINIATGVAFLEQKPVPLIESKAAYPGASDLQSFPKRTLPQWASTRSKAKTNVNKTGYRLTPLPKQDKDVTFSIRQRQYQDTTQANALDAFNNAKIEEFRWWHEKMRRISGEDNLRAPPNSALIPEPPTAVNEPELSTVKKVNSMASSRRKENPTATKKQRTIKSTSVGLKSEANNTSAGMIHIHQKESSIVRNPDAIHQSGSGKDPISERPKFKASLIEVHVPEALPDSSSLTPQKLKKRDRINQWLAQCEQAVETSDKQHWFRLPGTSSDDSRCSTCEGEFPLYGDLDMSKRDSISTRPSVDFTRARMARDDKVNALKPLRR